jgi:hypothetical protein
VFNPGPPFDEEWTRGYLTDVIHTRDPWMHRPRRTHRGRRRSGMGEAPRTTLHRGPGRTRRRHLHPGRRRCASTSGCRAILPRPLRPRPRRGSTRPPGAVLSTYRSLRHSEPNCGYPTPPDRDSAPNGAQGRERARRRRR